MGNQTKAVLHDSLLWLLPMLTNRKAYPNK